jgi:Mlc titration factor MtfA (ptsG expression regulator)
LISLRRKIQAWRRSRILSRFPIDDHLWQQVVNKTNVLAGLSQGDLRHLHDLVVLFLHHKRFFGTYDLEIDNYIRIAIAAQACLLVLHLDAAHVAEVYPGWESVIVYPGAFVARHDYRDEIGVVHARIMALEGEVTNRGPMAISWADARPGATPPDAGHNVVLHEFAHKLDFLDGKSNGHPPLHGDMSTETWSKVFAAAFDHLSHLIEQHHHTPFNPYAATNPAEFFAVMTEVFFQKPHRLRRVYPAVYDQLVLYYRQDPARRRLS